ncbi:hypothetical protein [Sharpea azabuensis]|uniref:hypothetical protein n=1 Tax=Sharpea azabuensis TaxID=322505 RepID=UPI001569F182|nr:hypothetical protein [Sharpea azabuensis]
MDKKNLLVVGNKIGLPNYNGYYISLKLYNQAIQNMDYVCRINRMHNYNVTTGVKTDGLYIGGWSDFIQQYRGGEHTDVIKTVKDIYVDVRAWNGGFDRKCREFITDE